MSIILRICNPDHSSVRDKDVDSLAKRDMSLGVIHRLRSVLNVPGMQRSSSMYGRFILFRLDQRSWLYVFFSACIYQLQINNTERILQHVYRRDDFMIQYPLLSEAVLSLYVPVSLSI